MRLSLRHHRRRSFGLWRCATPILTAHISGGCGRARRRPVPAQAQHPRARGHRRHGAGASDNGLFAAVVDADGARVLFVDLNAKKLRGSVALPPGSAPGRMAIDDTGDLYVALRATGEVAQIAFASQQVVAIRAVCGDPRGLAWDSKAQVMRVACADGNLAAVPREGAVTKQHVATDLRDVLVTQSGLSVTTFRSAQVQDLGTGTLTTLPTSTVIGIGAIAFPANVAWRSVVAPNGSVVVSHQLAALGPVESLKLNVPTTSTDMQVCRVGAVHPLPTPPVPARGALGCHRASPGRRCPDLHRARRRLAGRCRGLARWHDHRGRPLWQRHRRARAL